MTSTLFTQATMTNRKQTISKILGSFQIIRRAMLQQVAEQQSCKSNDNNVSLAQQMTLLTIAARGVMSVKEIAAARMISSSAATQVVNSLVDKGLLLRSQHTQDRRASVVTLGPQYEQRVAAHTKNAATWLTPMFDALSADELQEYERLNQKLVDALRKNTSPD